ncbi:hypothetical protein [Ruegeria sp.]|uniref:hypothetical protein n=1 Tax=Ruegeria sp. TaxID=1879320 RepID=UPI0023248825|nr:hypothetical protein [Ruegeria sp.]MDA7964999.1 hypothetical protein [Ruegeria sp.]
MAKILMWLKLGIGAAGFTIVIGYLVLSKAEFGSSLGGYVLVSFVLLMILILGVRDMLSLGLAKQSERKTRKK